MTVNIRQTVIGLLLILGGCGGPLPFMSGGALSGEIRQTPTEWSFDEDFGVVQLETRPDEPYSVNIAYTLLNGHLYIYAGDTETQWVKNMDANPNVRLRMSDDIYALRAERVSDPAEISTFAKVWVSHSIVHRDPEAQDAIWLYRLVGR